MRNPNIAVVKIGHYATFAFEDTQTALELMAILSKAVGVEEESFSLRDITPCTHFLAKNSVMPELKFIPVQKFEPDHTADEFKAKYEREQRNREDMEAQARVIPEPLALTGPGEVPF